MKDKTLKQLVESIKASGQPKTSAYDTSATVTRVENGVAWVHIPGGVTETPVKLTINAQAGDTVQVRVSGGRAFMVGNATAPPTDDRVANKALGETKTITKVVKTVQKLAERTAKIAGNTNQYFWHTETGADTGAHITEIPREDFLDDPTNGGGNLLARSNGVAVRDGLTELAQFTANGVSFNDSTGTGVASFGAGGSTVGKSTAAHMTQTPTEAIWYGPDGVKQMFRVSTDSFGSILYLTENRHINTSTSKSINDGVTTYEDILHIASQRDADHDHGSLELRAIGNNGRAIVYISDRDASGTATVAVSPTNVDFNTNVTLGKGSNNPCNLDVNGTIRARAVTSYTPTFDETVSSYSCVVSAGICHLFYQGESKAHSNGDSLMILPSGASPRSTIFAPFVKYGGAYGAIKIESGGLVTVGFITNNTITGRIYFNCSYPVA